MNYTCLKPLRFILIFIFLEKGFKALVSRMAHHRLKLLKIVCCDIYIVLLLSFRFLIAWPRISLNYFFKKTSFSLRMSPKCTYSFFRDCEVLSSILLYTKNKYTKDEVKAVLQD